jgi:hypothetical protein
MKSGSCGELVLVNEPAETVAPFDRDRSRVLGELFHRLTVERLWRVAEGERMGLRTLIDTPSYRRKIHKLKC